MNSPDLMIFEPTNKALSAEGAALGPCVLGASCFYSAGTYIQGTVSQRLSLVCWFQNIPPGDCRPGCSMFVRFPNLPNLDCWSGMQPVYMDSGPI